MSPESDTPRDRANCFAWGNSFSSIVTVSLVFITLVYVYHFLVYVYS